ncbi:glutamate--tRNA ligase [Microaerobacter geothermalis]|uniref:glutamate--tRNA ligase n=1 Tax=Microaerobacter geothermalis TaxID=674972 RepID=UPI001F489F98|nr:glutamate--tRNA ligase [Microaerobacter geothermalis]MCF6095182.1 glutamate--tRNA ligase [Microaerobacter geothermalis]
MAAEVRVRFAPSPTGHLHIGGARSAVFNYLFARNRNGKFIIRIEDTDQKRNVDEAAEKLLESMRWLGVEWDEGVDVGGDYGPYRSMERLHLYQPYVDQLLSSKRAYPCYCTEEELNAEREEQKARGEVPKYSGKCRFLTKEQIEGFKKEGRTPSIRFRVEEGKEYVVHDLIRGDVRFDSDGIGDFVILRPNGSPTYNFAVTIDDHLMKITHVIRGEEHLSNTPRQMMIYEALGLEMPQFAHVSLILNQDRQKMSKRDESIIQFVEQYRELGYLPEALLNFITLLGWSPEGEEEIFSKEQLIQLFSLERVSKSPSVFDIDKLKWMNNVYMKQAPLPVVVEASLPHLIKAGFVQKNLTEKEKEWTEQLIALYQEQMHYGAEIVSLASLFFKEEVEYEPEGLEILKNEQVPVVLRVFIEHLNPLADWSADEIKVALKKVQKETGFKGKALFMPVRVAATGQVHGRDLALTLYLLGKEKVVSRLQNVVNHYNEIVK